MKKHFVLPSSDSLFLSEILAGLRKRTKSIRYHAADFAVERVFEEYDDERVEKLALSFESLVGPSSIDISIWQDRWIKVSTSANNNQAKWYWSREGKLLQRYTSKHFVDSFQETRSKLFEMTESNTHRFDTIWKPLLANGPERI